MHAHCTAGKRERWSSHSFWQLFILSLTNYSECTFFSSNFFLILCVLEWCALWRKEMKWVLVVIVIHINHILISWRVWYRVICISGYYIVYRYNIVQWHPRIFALNNRENNQFNALFFPPIFLWFFYRWCGLYIVADANRLWLDHVDSTTTMSTDHCPLQNGRP